MSSLPPREAQPCLTPNAYTYKVMSRARENSQEVELQIGTAKNIQQDYLYSTQKHCSACAYACARGRVCETPHVSICMQNARRQRISAAWTIWRLVFVPVCARHAHTFLWSCLRLCGEGHRQKHNDEEDDSDKQWISERERQGAVAMGMTYSQPPHPIVVACGVIGFEMKEGGK